MTKPTYADGQRITTSGHTTTQTADNALLYNLRFRWKDIVAPYDDLELIDLYDDFYLSDMAGDNDERLPEFIEAYYQMITTTFLNPRSLQPMPLAIHHGVPHTWDDPHEVPPPRMAPLPDDAGAHAPTASHEDFIKALRLAEAACTTAKAERDAALARIEALKDHESLLRHLTQRVALLEEQLASEAQRATALLEDLDAQIASTTVWHNRYRAMLQRKEAMLAEIRVMLVAQKGMWRFAYRVLRNRALDIEAKGDRKL